MGRHGRLRRGLRLRRHRRRGLIPWRCRSYPRPSLLHGLLRRGPRLRRHRRRGLIPWRCRSDPRRPLLHGHLRRGPRLRRHRRRGLIRRWQRGHWWGRLLRWGRQARCGLRLRRHRRSGLLRWGRHGRLRRRSLDCETITVPAPAVPGTEHPPRLHPGSAPVPPSHWDTARHPRRESRLADFPCSWPRLSRAHSTQSCFHPGSAPVPPSHWDTARHPLRPGVPISGFSLLPAPAVPGT